MIVTQKVNKMVFVGARCIVLTGELDNNMTRAQFIVPLQHNYNQSYFLRDTRYKSAENIFGFLGSNHVINLRILEKFFFD